MAVWRSVAYVVPGAGALPCSSATYMPTVTPASSQRPSGPTFLGAVGLQMQPLLRSRSCTTLTTHVGMHGDISIPSCSLAKRLQSIHLTCPDGLTAVTSYSWQNPRSSPLRVNNTRSTLIWVTYLYARVHVWRTCLSHLTLRPVQPLVSDECHRQDGLNHSDCEVGSWKGLKRLAAYEVPHGSGSLPTVSCMNSQTQRCDGEPHCVHVPLVDGPSGCVSTDSSANGLGPAS